MKQKSPQELQHQIESTKLPYEEEDLVLSKEELIAKYKERYENGEISQDAIKDYVETLRKQRKGWREKLAEIDYKEFDTDLLYDIPAVFHNDITLKIIEAGQGSFVDSI